MSAVGELASAVDHLKQAEAAARVGFAGDHDVWLSIEKALCAAIAAHGFVQGVADARIRRRVGRPFREPGPSNIQSRRCACERDRASSRRPSGQANSRTTGGKA